MKEAIEEKNNNIQLFVFGIISCILTAYLTILLEKWFGELIHTWRYKLFITIPLGGFLVGMGASSGFYFGVNKFNYKMSSTTTLAIFLLPIISYILIEYLHYINLIVDGIHISERVSFLKYIGTMYGQANYSLSDFAMQLSGAAFGGAAILGNISEIESKGKQV